MFCFKKGAGRMVCSVVMVLGLLCSLLSPLGFNQSAEASASTRKIVVFADNVQPVDQDKIVASVKGKKVKDLSHTCSKVISISAKNAEKLKAKKEVVRVDDDIVISVDKPVTASKTSGQIVPWGISKINAPSAWTKSSGTNVKVAVLDTGIDLSHPDLKSDIKGGANMISPSKTADDDNGHGTHVAGIIGGENNTIGIVGVGPNISLYAVKALNKSGSGYLSDIIEGIDWSIKNKMDVINMSLGSGSDSISFHDAIKRAYTAGITIVAAAGNDYAGSVNYPAAYPEVIAVAATDTNNKIASFSDKGREVDISAPGVDILSSYKGNSYATLSGTSMATPHVAGVTALVIGSPVGKYDANHNGKWDPSEVQSKIESTATDLGVAGKDSIFGAGLVNALRAIQ